MDREIFMKKYWELAELEIQFFLSRPFFSFFFASSQFIWGTIYFCTLDDFFKILEKDFIQTKMHTTVDMNWSVKIEFK